MIDRTFAEKLAEIKADRSSGAAEIGRNCLAILADISHHDSSDSTAALLDELHEQTDMLAQARPSMAPVANLLNIFKEKTGVLRNLPVAEARKECAAAANKIIGASIEAAQKTAANVAALIGPNKTVFTHSYSSTVMQAFALLEEKGLKVIATESRPLCEGYRLAEKLSQIKIPTTLITDAQTGLFIRDADIVLVGADTILPDFSVINKVGTYPAALAAHAANIPFYVCSETYKQLNTGDKIPELETMDPDELQAPELDHVSIRNIYFEITPAELITGWINENGVQLFKSDHPATS